MNLFKFKSLLGALAMMALILTSCSDDSTNPETPGAKPEAVDSVAATSINNTTVALKWKVSASESDALFKCYVVDVLKEDGTPSPIASKTFSKGTNRVEIAGLEEGTVYMFQIRAQFTTDSLSTAKTIKWSPATRFTKNDNDNDILIYEYASSFGSGLSLFDEAAGAPKNLTAASKTDWQIGIDTRDNKLVFGSASQINIGTGTPTAKTEISNNYWLATSLNSVFDSEALSTGTFTEVAYDLNAIDTGDNNLVLIAKITKGTKVNYAKIMIIKDPTTKSFLWPSTSGSNNKYVKLEISYQKGDNVPYAKKSVK